MKPDNFSYIGGCIQMSKSGYPIWWDTTVTIYNKFVDTNTQVITWYRTVVTDCFWNLDGTKVSIGDVVLDSKSVLCRIPKDDTFLERKDWVTLAADEKKNYFTLGQGDIIVRGSVEDTINEYQAGHRSTDLLSKYREAQWCMEITDYSNNTGVGRNNEHYLVRGK